MNSAYAQAPPPHDLHRVSIPAINEAYRPGPSGAPQYSINQTGPLPQQGQPPYDSYGMAPRPPPPDVMHAADIGPGTILQPVQQPYEAYAMASRPQLPEAMLAGDGLAPLIPGAQPPSNPAPKSVIEKGRKYELCVVQQPQRARMCGFGDKDRRPITPPPCVRLIITDVATGKEVDCNEVEHGMFVLNVDLWDEYGRREVNLVRHTGSSPAISSTTPASYQDTPGAYSNIAPQQEFKIESGQQGPYNSYPNQPQVTAYSNGQPPQYNNAPAYHQGYAQPTNGGYAPQGYSQPPQPVYYNTAGVHNGSAPPGAEYGAPHQIAYNRQYAPDMSVQQRGPVSAAQPQGMFTRNLIGSLAASAFRLTDCDDKIGIWFVLQDLSVRTEGTFRLRFSFVNVGIPGPAGHSGPGQNVSTTTVNTGRASILASCFSEAFMVYSAKRFPGVVESTGLSKCFAGQGIKIPIRKDGPGKGDKDKDDDYD